MEKAYIKTEGQQKYLRDLMANEAQARMAENEEKKQEK